MRLLFTGKTWALLLACGFVLLMALVERSAQSPAASLVPRYAQAAGFRQPAAWVGAGDPAAIPPGFIRSFVFVGSAGGSVESVAVSNGFAYIGQGGALTVLDVRAAEPVLLARLPCGDFVQSVEVVGSRAYVALGSSGLQLVDISNPSSPILRGRTDMPGAARRLQVQDNLAYVASSGLGSGLQIVNLSDPARPVVQSSLPVTIGVASDVQVVGEVAYLAAGPGGGIQLVDIGNPEAPAFLGRTAFPGTALRLEAVADLLYLADGGDQQNSGGLRIFTLSDPASPAQVGRTSTSGTAAVAVADALAYVLTNDGTMQILDTDDPETISPLGRYSMGAAAADIQIESDRAYIAAGSGGLHIVDVGQPLTPTLHSSFATLAEAQSVQVAGDLAYVAGGSSGLHVFDVSNPALPALRSRVATPGAARLVQVVDGLAYVATGTAGVQVWDISDPFSLTLRSTLPATGGAALSVAVAGTQAYVAAGSGGVQVWDISDVIQAEPLTDTALMTPTLLASYNTPGSALSVQVISDTLYVADDSSLQILDVSQPLTPTLRGSYAPDDADIRAVQVISDTAYLVDAGLTSNGLHLLDVSDPLSPTLLSSLPIAGLRSVSVVDGVAYIAVANRGMQIVDVSDPTRPKPGTRYDTPGSSYALEVAGELVYVADYDGGLQILRLRDLPARSLFLPVVKR